MESSDSIDKSWDTTSDLTTTTALRSDPLASDDEPSSGPGGWMVNVAGRDIVEMSHADVIAKLRIGELARTSLVWREGMDTWAKLDTVPAFQVDRKAEESEAPTAPEEANAMAVYERPMATLVFDEAVEEEWKAPPNPREASKSSRASESSKSSRSVSGRPVAPTFPSFAPRKNPSVPAETAARRREFVSAEGAPSRSLSVPADEPPPPPPLPSRSPRPSGRPAPTIPGGLAPPSPSPSSAPMSSGARSAGSGLSKSPPTVANKPLTLTSLPASKPQSAPPVAVAPVQSASPTKSPPPAPSSSPLLAAIASATDPGPAVVASSSSNIELPASTAVFEELSISARLRAMKSVPLKSAVLACAGSALLASLLTGVVVGSRSRPVARTEEAPIKPAAPQAAAPPPVVTPPAAAPAPSPTTAEVAPPETPAPQKLAAPDPEVVEKPKPKTTKVATWKPPKPVATAGDETAESDKPAPNPERDDPERAVPDRVDGNSTAQPATWQANPGF